MTIVNLDGGDLGIGKFTNIEMIPIIIEHISKFMLDVRPHLKFIDDHHVLSYGITVGPQNKDILEKVLTCIRLPQGCEYYECDGRKVFEIRGASGGIVSGVIFYLIVR